MSFTTGHNFSAGTKARASEVNENFAWVRGHYLPFTQSDTWTQTDATYDLGSASFRWRNLYLSGTIESGAVDFANVMVSTATHAELAADQNWTSGATTLVAVNLGNVTAGERVLIYAAVHAQQATDTVTSHLARIRISKSSGSGSIVFPPSAAAAEGQLVYAGDETPIGFGTHFSTFGVIDGTGSLILQMTHQGSRASASFKISATDTGMQAIVLND